MVATFLPSKTLLVEQCLALLQEFAGGEGEARSALRQKEKKI
jgi:hypothetical protein